MTLYFFESHFWCNVTKDIWGILVKKLSYTDLEHNLLKNAGLLAELQAACLHLEDDRQRASRYRQEELENQAVEGRKEVDKTLEIVRNWLKEAGVPDGDECEALLKRVEELVVRRGKANYRQQVLRRMQSQAKNRRVS